MIDVLLLRFNVNIIHLWNISGFSLQSASRSYANAYVNVF